jgi:hypothetical protein
MVYFPEINNTCIMHYTKTLHVLIYTTVSKNKNKKTTTEKYKTSQGITVCGYDI